MTSQEFRNGSDRSFLRGLRRHHQGVGQGCRHHRAWLTFFQAPSCACWQDSVPHRLWARGHTQILARWGSPEWQLASPKHARQKDGSHRLLYPSHQNDIPLVERYSVPWKRVARFSSHLLGGAHTRRWGTGGPPAVHHSAPSTSCAAHFPALPRFSPLSIREFNNTLSNSEHAKCRGIADLTLILSAVFFCFVFYELEDFGNTKEGWLLKQETGTVYVYEDGQINLLEKSQGN